MIDKIKKINDVRGLIENSAADAAIAKLFKENNQKIRIVSAEIAEAQAVLADASTEAVKLAMKQLLEEATYHKDMLKAERKEAKKQLAEEEEEWDDESPIDIGDILEKIFRS